MYDKGGFSDFDNSNQIIINFETMWEEVRKFEPEFKDDVNYCVSYKSHITYINIHREKEPEILEAYILITKKHLYCF